MKDLRLRMKLFGLEKWSETADRVSGIMRTRQGREEAYEVLLKKRFLPNSPALVNAGRAPGRNLTACNILVVPNDLKGIFDTVTKCAMLLSTGAGVGLDFSDLDPAAGGRPGPVGFLPTFAGVSQVIGSYRNVALMGTLNASHLDIRKFVRVKEEDGRLSQFNLSVTLDGGPGVVFPGVWDEIVLRAHANGEPGVVFLDNINRHNPTLREFGPVRAVSACGEFPHYDHGSCVLGSIALPHVIEKPGDWELLRETVRFAVRFLDRVIDVNHWPLREIGSQARRTRDIGIGVMGWADLLEREGIPFVSEEALSLAAWISAEIRKAAYVESWVLAEERGGYLPGRLRNRVLTTIAPTGTISRLAGVSPSIYPPYGAGLALTPEEHLDLIQAWQSWVDNGISYTVSFPSDGGPDTVDRIFRGAWERGLKGISVYRDGSRAGQPLKCPECEVIPIPSTENCQETQGVV